MWTRAAGTTLIIAVLAAGCIDESDVGTRNGAVATDSAPPADQTASSSTVNATLSEWTITLSETTLPHGTVTFEIRNSGTEDHAFEVVGANNQEWKTDPIKPGATATLSVALAAGSYDVYCPLASGGEAHMDRGMKTTVAVK